MSLIVDDTAYFFSPTHLDESKQAKSFNNSNI